MVENISAKPDPKTLDYLAGLYKNRGLDLPPAVRSAIESSREQNPQRQLHPKPQ